MWSYSTSNPQRPQTKEAIQEFHSHPPACPPACQMCRLKCVLTLHMSSLQETRSGNYFKDESKSMWCWGWGMPTPYAGSMSDWVRWVEKAKTVKFSGFINLWSWRTPKKHSREDRKHNWAYPRSLVPQVMGEVRKAQAAMSDTSRTENCLCVGEVPIKPEDQPSVKDVVGLFDVWDTSQYLSLRCHQELGLYWRG